jgi:spore coat protein JB
MCNAFTILPCRNGVCTISGIRGIIRGIKSIYGWHCLSFAFQTVYERRQMSMNETCNDRNALFRKIHECEFMMIDLGLYLDTHPDCVQALNAFQKHRASYQKHAAEYERLYGPLTFYSVSSDTCWPWQQLPWPWEMEAYN